MTLFFWQLDAYSLFDRTETETAEVARQMWERGDLVTPFFNDIRYFDKPVLLYWLIAAGFTVFGVGEWAVRFPSAVFATLLVIGTWLFVARLTNQRTALFAATMLAANPFVFGLGRTGVTDIGLTFFLAGALCSWYWSYSSQGRGGYLWFFVLLALAVLIKGPLALVLCTLIIGIFLMWTDGWRSILPSMPWIWGTLLFVGLTLPWYVLVTWANGWDFINAFFVHHNVNRFLNVVDKQPGPWYYYLLYTPGGFFPWVVLLPVGLRHLRFSSGYWRNQPASRQLDLFIAIWLIVVLVFLSSASTKLPHYIAPALPALAFLCARAWEVQTRAPGRGLRLGLGIVCGGLVALAAGFAFILDFVRDPALPELQTSIERTGAPWLLSAVCLAAAVGILFSMVRRQAFWAWAISLLTFATIGLTAIDRLMPVLEGQIHGHLLDIADVLRREADSGYYPATLGVYAPSLNFYSGIDRIPVYETRAQVRYRLAKNEHLLLVTTDARLSETGLDLTNYRPVRSAGIYKLFVLPPSAYADVCKVTCR